MQATQVRRWTREEYDRMIAAGMFKPGERIELIDGEILQMPPQGSAHFTAIQLAEEALRGAFGAGFVVRTRAPLALGPDSEPEPDIAVASGNARDYREAHPATALLLVEVADSTLDYDRRRKGELYARAGIREYWIVNLLESCLEVYRDPDQGIYLESRRLAAGDEIVPLTAPDNRPGPTAAACVSLPFLLLPAPPSPVCPRCCSPAEPGTTTPAARTDQCPRA